MTLTQKNKLSKNLVNIMTEIEDEILHKIAKQLAADNNISDTSKWRIRQLARSEQLKRESLELIKSYSGIQSESLYDALQAAALEEISNVDRAAREAIKNGLLSGSTDIPASRTAENALKAYYKQAKSDLNMVNTVMGYQASQAFVNAVNDVYGYVHKQLDRGTAKVVTDSESLQTAIRKTIKDLSKHGIPAFVDKRGYHWSPESYVRMDLRTTLGNTANAAQWSRCDQFGISLISVDSHSGSRPLCAPYQGRVFSRDGTFGVTSDGSGKRIEYSPLSSTSYGKPAGLFGINCGHSSYPFIPGINIQRYFPVDPEENAAKYKELQKQRQLEREIRAGKRECMMLQAAGDEEGYKKAALRLRTKREQYKVYSNAHDLSLHNDRTRVYGFDRSKSMKTVWAEKKAENTVKAKINNAHSQNFRPLIYGEQERITRGGQEVILKRINTTVNDIYLSQNSRLKRKSLHKIDTNVSKALKKMGLSSAENLPKIYIITTEEMKKGAIASYNPITNVLCIDENFGYRGKLLDLQKDGACPSNELSTIVHELFHWSDAQEYSKHHGAITAENYNNYIEHLNKNRKNILDKLEITEYNVNKISNYADSKYSRQCYDEVFTEYRVLDKLKE